MGDPAKNVENNYVKGKQWLPRTSEKTNYRKHRIAIAHFTLLTRLLNLNAPNPAPAGLGADAFFWKTFCNICQKEKVKKPFGEADTAKQVKIIFYGYGRPSAIAHRKLETASTDIAHRLFKIRAKLEFSNGNRTKLGSKPRPSCWDVPLGLTLQDSLLLGYYGV